MTVIAEFDAGISEATMHALADEILKYRRAVRLLAKAVGWADVGAPFALIAPGPRWHPKRTIDGAACGAGCRGRPILRPRWLGLPPRTLLLYGDGKNHARDRSCFAQHRNNGFAAHRR